MEHRICCGMRTCVSGLVSLISSPIKYHTKAGPAAPQVQSCWNSLMDFYFFSELPRMDCTIAKLDVSTKGIQWQT